jgi:hypothetical protein
MRVWIGFAVGSSSALLVTALFSERMTAGQTDALWLAAMSVNFINHAVWHREKGVGVSGSLGIAAALISLVFAPTLALVGWIVLGCGEAKIGWVTTVSGVSKLDYPILPPEDPTAVSMFLTKTLEALPQDAKPVILGDFLDNMIPHMDESLFYKYYCDLASAARVSNHTAVFIVNADIHSEVEVNVVKRFADVIIENREREERRRLVREVRVSNRVDEIHTDWERY